MDKLQEAAHDWHFIEHLHENKIKYLYRNRSATKNNKEPDLLFISKIIEKGSAGFDIDNYKFNENEKIFAIFESKRDWSWIDELKVFEQVKNNYYKNIHEYLTDNFFVILWNWKNLNVYKYKKDEEFLLKNWNRVLDMFLIEHFTIEKIKKELEIDLEIEQPSFVKIKKEKKPITNRDELFKFYDKINEKLRNVIDEISIKIEVVMIFLFLQSLKNKTDIPEDIKLKFEILNDEKFRTKEQISDLISSISKIYTNELIIKIPDILYKNESLMIFLYEEIVLQEICYDTDLKGDAFEYFLNYNYLWNNWFWQYFTPRHIVDMIIKKVFEYNDSYMLFDKTFLDPCCGSGWFITQIFKELKNKLFCSNFEEENKMWILNKIRRNSIYWNDLWLSVYKYAKMNMILSWDWHTNIINDNFLYPKDENKLFFNNKYDNIVTNIPFWKKELWEKEVHFVTKIFSLLKDNGFMFIIIPDWFLSNKTKDYIELRKNLLFRWTIKEIISLPQIVFNPYTDVKTSVVIIQNKITKEDYEISYSKIEEDWYFKIKWSSKKLQRDLNFISDIDRYLEIEKDWNKQILDKRYKIKRSELLNNFYFKDIEKRDILNNEIEDLNIKIEQISKIKDKKEIQNLLKIDLSNKIKELGLLNIWNINLVYKDKINFEEKENVEYKFIQEEFYCVQEKWSIKDNDFYIEIGDIKNNTYKLIKKQKNDYKWLKLQEGDILISKARPWNWVITQIKNNDKELICTWWFTVLRHKEKDLRIADYLFEYLKGDKTFFKYLNNVSEWFCPPSCKDSDILEYKFPLLNSWEMNVFVNLLNQKNELLKKLTVCEDNLNSMFMNYYNE